MENSKYYLLLAVITSSTATVAQDNIILVLFTIFFSIRWLYELDKERQNRMTLEKLIRSMTEEDEYEEDEE